jgi:uncharacterized YccA/Bax inhibitor family protein
VPNPILNDKTFEEAQSGWAAPQAPSPGGTTWAPPGGTPTTAPVTDGPVSPWRGVMTIRGSITATAVLFVLLLASATVGWISTTGTTTNPDGTQNITFPVVAMIGVIVGFIAVIALYFKPHLAKFLGPVYAIAEGFFVGSISKVFESLWNGIVLQAALATICVFAVMLALYGTRIIKVTERMRRTIIFATLGVMALYLVSFVLTLFGGSISFISDASPLGIGFSVLVCALAAFNLMLDFDFIERGTKAGLSKDYEWVAAVGLLVTIVWLYLEILRLLAKLRSN